jgi:hypothetical protein
MKRKLDTDHDDGCDKKVRTSKLSHIWDFDPDYFQLHEMRQLVDEYALDLVGRLLYLDRRFTIVMGRYNPQEPTEYLMEDQLKDAKLVTREARAVVLTPEVQRRYNGDTANDGTFVTIDSGPIACEWLPDKGPHLDHQVVLLMLTHDYVPIAWEWIPTYEHTHVCDPDHLHHRPTDIEMKPSHTFISSSSSLQYEDRAESSKMVLRRWAIHLHSLWLYAI